tara:strand:- start:135 stop:596 length:462 start_codon:yes stop_codon:yes gene_type:complete
LVIHTQYPLPAGSPTEKSLTDVWNHLNQYVWGKSGAESTPAGTWSAEKFAIRPLIDINVNKIKDNTTQLQKAISDNTKQWSSIESNKKYIETHTHNGTSNTCAFFDIPCKLKQIQNQMVLYAVIGAGAYVGIKYGYPILKKAITGRYPSGAKV